MAIEQVSLAELKAELAKTRVTRGIQEVVVHHTWSPTAVQYQGKATWEAIRRYHTGERGWSDIGYHYGVGPDGTLWKLRPVTRSGAHVLNRNQHTVGVVLLGNFDVEDPARCGLPRMVELVRMLVERFRLPPAGIRFHREFQNKTCPGTKLDLGAFRKMVAAPAAAQPCQTAATRTIMIVDHETVQEVGRFELVANGDHIKDQGKVYVKQ
ncbi:MAG: peptidoglycan recognition family protein [Armatimonadia bacterium]